MLRGRMRNRPGFSLLLLSPIALLLFTHCTVCNPGGQEAQRYTAGRVLDDGNAYETTGVYDEMLFFPSGRRYDIVHGLGRSPTTVNSYVSFASQLRPAKSESESLSLNTIAESAGNQVVIERWDDEVVRIRNDTCVQDFYVRIVLTANDDATLLGAGGMSGANDSMNASSTSAF